MKFAILGAGGTGGCLAGYLIQSGADVTVLARGAHLAAMQTDGLTIHRDVADDIHVAPSEFRACTADAYNDTPDVLLVCVKYYSIADAVALARRVAGPDTLIIPILNVFGTGEVMQKDLPGLTCLDGCIYIWALREAPGVISQSGKILRVFFGFRPGQDDRLALKAQEVEKILRAAGISAHFSDDIRRDALQKFAFVSPMGACGLYENAVSGDMQPGGRARGTFVELVKEVKALGSAIGVQFAREPVAEGCKIMDASALNLTTSMQRDVAAGGRSEFAGLVDRVAALAEKYHVDVPLYQKISAWGKEKGIR